MSWRDDLPRPHEVEYKDWPRETSLADYSRAADEVVELVEASATNASVYQLGGIRAPGISDLDFVIVLKDTDPDSDLRRWADLAGSLSPVARYVLETKPYIIDASLWATLPVLQESADLRHLSGPVLPPHALSSAPDDASRLFGEIERRLFLTNKEPRSFLKRSVHVRRAIKKLAKIGIQAHALAAFGIHKPRWSDFAAEVTKLRRDWFSLRKSEQTSVLYDLLIDMQEIDCEMILEISGLMARAGMEIQPLPQTDRRIIGILDYTTVFVTEYSPQRSLEYAVKSYKITDRIVSLLPANFLLPIMIYAHLSPALRTILEHRTTTFGEQPDIGQLHLQPSIIDRAGVLDQYSRFNEAHHCRWALLFNLWHPSDVRTGNPRQFWQKAGTRTKQIDDILLLLMGKQIEQAHPRLAGRFTHGGLKVLLLFRNLRDRLAPPGSLPRRVGKRLVGILAAPLRM